MTPTMPRLSLPAVLAVLACAPWASAARITVGGAATENVHGTGGQQLAAGQQLRNRFVLIERLGSASKAVQGEQKEAHGEGGEPVPGKDFPNVGRLATYGNSLFRSVTFQGPEDLGMGSFGDAWKAYDHERKEYTLCSSFSSTNSSASTST